ncbi:Eco57I restriction-modification methylase domain-containing protein [Aestuariivirga sp.]|uniref:Eco57I restriction-modification methylase domain-containing protein n=1 Tax=Aestuariivirga sp. TaxID=2650926 RepID=UPI0025B824E3|nr:Eco57I restriction-modification methylase domain-containing protein [Aestuariivirga sp.]
MTQLQAGDGGLAANRRPDDGLHTLLRYADNAGRSFVAGITRDDQKASGQFMTPPKIAKFMAQRLASSADHQHVRILEPSAGGGILIAALVEALLERQRPPAVIEALLYELDIRLLPTLEAVCRRIRGFCAAAGIRFEYDIRGEDFLLSELALRGAPVEGLITIANPPFFKLKKSSDERARRHNYAVYGQPNAYGLFMAATARLTPADGRWCFIVPRSWMNGQYFKAVRQTMMRHLTFESLHAFESRTDSFEEDAVLQETIVAWANGRSTEERASIRFSSSHGMSDLDQALVQVIPAGRVLSDDEHARVSLPADSVDTLGGWTATLATYGLKVSTGPVVAFRCREFISSTAGFDTVPLLWMQHVGQHEINWPILRKSDHVRATAANAWTLVANAPMVIMRRFSPKEEQRRAVCAPYLGTLPGAVIGLENHLNYIHRPNGQMSASEVRGLAALLASSIVDRRLRSIAGSTQINASELRSLPLPPMGVIEAIGDRISAHPTLREIDEAVQSELERSAASARAAA